MKNVILIFLYVLIPLIYGDDDIKCESNYGHLSFTVCFKNSELVHVNQTKHEDTLLITEYDFVSIAPNAFQDLSISKLELPLGQTRWEFIPPDPFRMQQKSFEGLRQLKSLSITEGILQLEHNIFAALESLEILFMSVCRFTFAKNGSFTGLPKLRELTIEYTKQYEMLPGIFTGLDGLKSLQLYQNKITTIQKNVFNHIKHLDLLNLSWNKISTIEAGAFDGMSIKTLNLEFNKLTVIPGGTFNGASIKCLKLGFNTIVQIEPNAFGNSVVEQLQYLGERVTIDKRFWSGLGESTLLTGTCVLD